RRRNPGIRTTPTRSLEAFHRRRQDDRGGAIAPFHQLDAGDRRLLPGQDGQVADLLPAELERQLRARDILLAPFQSHPTPWPDPGSRVNTAISSANLAARPASSYSASEPLDDPAHEGEGPGPVEDPLRGQLVGGLSGVSAFGIERVDGERVPPPSSLGRILPV